MRHTSGSLKAEVYAEYSINRRAGHYEIDHFIPLSLGGADVRANLWPQSYDSEPWNASVKDRLEWRLLHLVCRGEVPLATAQRDISRDWIAAFGKFCPTASACPSYADSHGGAE